MPLYIRHLPGDGMKILQDNTLPDNVVAFNPSVSYPILYLRGNKHSLTTEENFIILYNLEKKKTNMIPSPMHFLKKTHNMYQGLEDLRICWHNDRLWFSATTTHVSDNMTSELVVGYFDYSLNKVERLSAVDIGILPVKNVCPFVWNNRICLFDIYLKAIYEISDEMTDDGKWIKFLAKKIKSLKCGGSYNVDDYRGSTSPIHLHGNTWGCIVHDIIFNDQTNLVTRLSYIHHWIEFNIEEGLITFVSSPFWAVNWGIEYISGMHLYNNKENVDLFIGINDMSCVTYHTTLSNLRTGK